MHLKSLSPPPLSRSPHQLLLLHSAPRDASATRSAGPNICRRCWGDATQHTGRGPRTQHSRRMEEKQGRRGARVAVAWLSRGCGGANHAAGSHPFQMAALQRWLQRLQRRRVPLERRVAAASQLISVSQSVSQLVRRSAWIFLCAPKGEEPTAKLHSILEIVLTDYCCAMAC